ncbi:prophage antirepressor-like protein [Rhodoblastus acidophilus]|uniref:BRO-N domain-containing protein n=1 Tax=Rhodoblastus acidophilus TaxID=1074 RepID=UPI0022257875|nr:BRO family protein [Rhodoblastus acidophilus]MCW2318583.1 prophage antirepressor-like protein [Rhodoblastus acidophilus]
MFDSQAVRTSVEDGEPWFVVKDVCAVLGIKNSRSTLYDVNAEDVRVISNDTNRGLRTFNAVNEAGLYHLIFRSRKPAARRFFQWVAKEVLPQIRKTGQYQTPSLEQPKIAPAADSERLKKERARGQEVAVTVIDTISLVDQLFENLAPITAIIERSTTTAQAFNAATLTSFTERCPHCRTALPGLLSESTLDLTTLLALKARELDIEWCRLQPVLTKLRALVGSSGSAEDPLLDYLKEVKMNKEDETPPSKH